MDCSPPGSSVHGILQARVLEQIAISFSRGSSQLRDQTQVSRIAGRLFTIWATRKPQMLEWVAISSPGDLPKSGIEPMSHAAPALAEKFFTSEPLGKSSTQFSTSKTNVPQIQHCYSSSNIFPHLTFTNIKEENFRTPTYFLISNFSIPTISLMLKNSQLFWMEYINFSGG